MLTKIFFTNCFLLAMMATPSLIPASDTPNILLIIGDDISYRDYGFMGAKHVDTPNLDQLAREGMTYTRGYVPTSLCRASLMSIITGLYPHQHGVVGNDPPKGEDRAKMLWAIRTHETIPKFLTTKGYASFQSGKWWEGAPSEGGFTSGMTHGDATKGGRHGDAGLKIGRDSLEPIESAVAKSQQEKKPFFVWYAPMLPHTPHDPPADLLAKYQPKTDSIHVAKYWANVERFDRTVSELREILKRHGVFENTLIVYMHDNGWIQDPNAGKFAARSKRSPYEGGVRTPLILHWPGKIKPVRDEQTLVSSLDVAPTIAGASGAAISAALPGMNLLAAPTEQRERRTAVFGESFSHDVASLNQPEKGLEHRWCIEGNWKLIYDANTRRCELYDLANDPEEQSNVASSNPASSERLLKRLDVWWDGKHVVTKNNDPFQKK